MRNVIDDNVKFDNVNKEKKCEKKNVFLKIIVKKTVQLEV